MQVSSTTTSGANSAGSSAKKSATVDYQAFLQLLVAQMKNQDPTNPTDSGEFLSQLASFSSVEQAIQTNVKLDSMLTGSLLTQADSVIGRTLVSKDGTLSGKIVSVTLSDGSLTALLDNGKSLAITNGVTVKA
jgi:flagellar basal-body rod modification protein FlgD